MNKSTVKKSQDATICFRITFFAVYQFLCMRRISLISLFLLDVFFSPAQTFTPIDQGSTVRFVIKNFGFNTEGTFKGLSGSIHFDPLSLSTDLFDVSVDAKTIETGSDTKNSHLKKPDFFDVEKFPKLFFKSVKITKSNKSGYFYMFGNITIKAITKQIEFPFTVTIKNGGYLFEGEFKLNRRDFGVGGKSWILSDELTVDLSVFAKKN